MKNLFCKRLAARLCMKQPQSPTPEPAPVNRNVRGVANGEQLNLDSLRDNDATRSTHAKETESVELQLLKRICVTNDRICDILEARVRREEDQADRQLYEDARENEMKNDWMLAAAVLDRILAIVFIVIYIGGTVIFFGLFARGAYNNRPNNNNNYDSIYTTI